MSASRIGAAFAALLAGTSIAAGACPQSLAAYEQTGSRLSLAFDGATADTDAVMHRFHVVASDTGARMDGVVMMVDDPVRPWGMVMYRCPEGDVTGAEIDACTVWEGEMLAVDADGAESFIPVPDTGYAAPVIAAPSLRLPGFAAALVKSSVWDKTASIEPTDLFELKGCQE